MQNVRNNKNHRRTPKWVQRYGLVNTAEIKRKQRRSQWANRYGDRLPQSTLRDQPYEEGQEGGSSVDLASEEGSVRGRNGNGEFWNRNEESFYNANGGNASVASSARWRYPANFEDAAPASDAHKKSRRKKKDKKDRWARTEDAYAAPDTDTASRRRKSKKKRSVAVEDDTYSRASSAELPIPEDPEGGLYGEPRREQAPEGPRSSEPMNDDDIFNQEV